MIDGSCVLADQAGAKESTCWHKVIGGTECKENVCIRTKED